MRTTRRIWFLIQYIRLMGFRKGVATFRSDIAAAKRIREAAVPVVQAMRDEGWL